MLTLVEIAVRSVKSYSKDRCSLYAASITYYSLVSLFPLALFAIGIAGFFFQSDADQQRIVDELTGALPLSEGQDELGALISNSVNARGALGIVGLLGTAWAGSALFGAVRASLSAVYQKEKRRPFVKAKLLDIALVLGFTTLLMLSLALTMLIALAQRFSADLFGDEAATLTSWLLTLAYPTIPAAVSFLVFLLLYTVVAAAGLRKSDAAWGALVATLGFEALKIGFAQYIAYFGNYDATYGAIGFLVALLAFFYISAQVMLVGAEIAESRMLVLMADPPQRLREVHAIRDKLRSLTNKVKSRLGLKVELPESDPSGSQGAASNASHTAPTGVANAASGEQLSPSESSRPARSGGVGPFLSGILLGSVAALALRRRRPEDQASDESRNNR